MTMRSKNTVLLWFGFTLVLSRAASAHPDAEVNITLREGYRYVISNGLPDHDTGVFPNPGNPNTISVQNYEFRMPAEPLLADKTTPIGMFPFGVAVNGVPFDPSAAAWSGGAHGAWRFEALSGAINLGLDEHHAHVQPGGAYHYHGIPTGLMAKRGGAGQMTLVGYAADGFPIYGPQGYAHNDAASGLKEMKPSYRVKSGIRPNGPGGAYDGSFFEDYEFVVDSGDLDECNGRVGVTPEYPKGIYHYYLTNAFPFVPRCWKGTPDQSFLKLRAPPPGSHGGPPPPRPGFPPPPYGTQ